MKLIKKITKAPGLISAVLLFLFACTLHFFSSGECWLFEKQVQHTETKKEKVDVMKEIMMQKL